VQPGLRPNGAHRFHNYAKHPKETKVRGSGCRAQGSMVKNTNFRLGVKGLLVKRLGFTTKVVRISR
jgi:hypothetical protein